MTGLWLVLVLTTASPDQVLPRVQDPTAIVVATLATISAIAVALITNRRPRRSESAAPIADPLAPPPVTRVDVLETNQATQHSEIKSIDERVDDVVESVRRLTERLDRHIDTRGPP